MQLLKRFKKILKSPRNHGFTFIELLITLSIFVILSTIMLGDYNKFNKRISIDTLAHEVAQWIRDAQVSAMSVKQVAGGNTFPGYGLHFSMANPTQFILFADKLTPNRMYDPGTGACGSSTTECERIITLLQGNTIEGLCGQSSGSSATTLCGNLNSSSQFDITFLRPNPDAMILGDLGGANFPTQYSRARILLKSPSGFRRLVEVWTTAQVSVQ